MKRATRLPDVFSAGELARVTGLPVRQIRALIRTAAIPTVNGALVARHDAFRACRALLDGRLTAPVSGSGSGLLSRDRADSTRTGRATGVSLLVSGSVHAAVLAVILVLATVAVPSARPDDAGGTPPELVQLYCAVSGPDSTSRRSKRYGSGASRRRDGSGRRSPSSSRSPGSSRCGSSRIQTSEVPPQTVPLRLASRAFLTAPLRGARLLERRLSWGEGV